jgi:hypothetical protein
MPGHSHYEEDFLSRWPYMSECDDCDGDIVIPREPRLSRFRLAKRVAWRFITLNECVTYALETYQWSWMSALGLIMAISWTDFLHKHVEGLFNDGTNDLPLMTQQLFYVIAITLVCTALPSIVVNVNYAYYSRCVPVHRRVFRQRFRKLVKKILEDEPYARTYELEYDSDGCPDAQLAFLRERDMLSGKNAFIASRKARAARATPEISNKQPLLAAPVVHKRKKIYN